MKVEVRLYGSLRRFRPTDAAGVAHSPFAAELPDGATIETLCGLLRIPDGLAGAAAVNDEAVLVSTPLKSGDRVSLFPPSAGGRC